MRSVSVEQSVQGDDRGGRRIARVPPRWFDELYAADPDPWGFASSPYEREKYRATIEALDGRRYASGFEAGCSIGVLTTDLAVVCDQLLAVDAADVALIHARARTAALPNVEVRRAVLPEDWPDAKFDLVVLSEMAYYFDRSGFDELLDRATASLTPGGDLLAVHWTGETDYPLTGEDVHRLIRDRPELNSRVSWQADQYHLDVLARR